MYRLIAIVIGRFALQRYKPDKAFRYFSTGMIYPLPFGGGVILRQTMLKSCSYCGKIHPRDYVCPCKPQYTKHNIQINRFRNSKAWRTKRVEIAQRDLHMCRLCAIESNKYNSSIRVHQITPLAEDYSMRLDNGNLISLCSYHHELAENGKIPREALRKVVKTPPLPL